MRQEGSKRHRFVQFQTVYLDKVLFSRPTSVTKPPPSISHPWLSPRLPPASNAGGHWKVRLCLWCVSWSDSWMGRRAAWTAAETFNVSAHGQCANTSRGSQLSALSRRVSFLFCFANSQHEWAAVSILVLTDCGKLSGRGNYWYIHTALYIMKLIPSELKKNIYIYMYNLMA